MREVVGDIWDYHAKGHWVGITTNAVTKENGEAVMGRGIALQAAQRFPLLARQLGAKLRHDGNHGNRYRKVVQRCEGLRLRHP